jgi:hypothetical protein
MMIIIVIIMFMHRWVPSNSSYGQCQAAIMYLRELDPSRVLHDSFLAAVAHVPVGTHVVVYRLISSRLWLVYLN